MSDEWDEKAASLHPDVDFLNDFFRRDQRRRAIAAALRELAYERDQAHGVAQALEKRYEEAKAERDAALAVRDASNREAQKYRIMAKEAHGPWADLNKDEVNAELIRLTQERDAALAEVKRLKDELHLRTT